MKALFKFTFDGLEGAVFADGTVAWGGMSFQLEAAGDELRRAIEAARPT